MKVVKPTTYNSALHLVSTTAVETHAAYSSGTTYATGDKVNYGGFIYQSLVNSNLNHQPDISPLEWVKLSPDNRSAMFDTEVSTATTATTSLTVVLSPGYISSLAFFNIMGSTLSISVKDSPTGSVVYTKTIMLDGAIIADWYQYFFEPSAQLTEVVLTDIPPYFNARVTITITGTTVQIGSMIFGTVYDLGATQYGTNLGIIDYSKKDTSETGVTTFIKRGFSKRMQAQMMIDNTQITKTQKVLSELRATPAVWIASDDSMYVALSMLGFYKDFNIDISYPSKSLCTLEVESLTQN